MKTKYFKDFKSGEIECIKSYENRHSLRVCLTVDKERCKVYCFSMISGPEVFSLNKEAIELSAGEALDEIDEFIEEVKKRLGYKALERELSEESRYKSLLQPSTHQT